MGVGVEVGGERVSQGGMEGGGKGRRCSGV